MTSREGSSSGTGVFYQAMPAVGADGRNIMKLIPVKMVNGHYVPSQATLNKDINEAQLPITLNFNPTPNVHRQKAPSVASANRQLVIKQRPLPSASHTLVNVTRRCSEAASSLNKCLPLESPKIPPKVILNSPSLTPQVFDGGTSSNLSMQQLPVTVKSPVLPNGQYLQIPPNAQVKSLPASALPPAVKKHIFSTAQCASNSKLPNVLYVSPVKTINQSVSQPSPAPSPSLSLKRLSKTSGTEQKSFPSMGSPLSSNSKVREDRERPKSPIKWVIEEEAGSAGPCLVPVNSTSIASDILQALAMRDNTKNPVKCAPLEPSETKAVQGKDNALVMYSGKVYFVAKKCHLSPEPQVATLNPPSSGTTPSPTLALPQVPNKTKQDKKQTLIPVVPDEVIDLCDDDQYDPLYPAEAAEPSAGQSDEDNVIFVSYVPPALVSGSGEKSIKIAHVIHNALNQNINNCPKDLNGQRMSLIDGLSVKTCKDIDTVENKAGSPISAEIMFHPNVATVQVEETSPILLVDGSHIKVSSPETTVKHVQTPASSEQRDATHPTRTQQFHSVDGFLTPESPTHSGSSFQVENAANTKEGRNHVRALHESGLDPNKENQTSGTGLKTLPTSDHQLKKMFGITSDIKVCLMKVDAIKAKASPTVPLKTESTTKHTLEGIRKLIQEANMEVRRRRHNEAQMSPTTNLGSFSDDSKRLKMAEPESTVNCHTILNHQLDTHPNPTLQKETESLGSPSSLSEMIHDYEEPINDDIFSTSAEKQLLRLSPPPTAIPAPDCVMEPCCAESNELNTKPRRKGRPKRCTVCPCGAQDIVSRTAHANLVKQKGQRPPRKSASASASATITPCLKNERTLVKDTRAEEKGEPVEIHFPSATSKLDYYSAAEIPASDNFHTAAMEQEDILSLERIERLKELLKEKESALEMIRNNIN